MTSPSCSRSREFFDLDKADYGLAPVRVETWEGFIFVNLDATDTTPLRDYLGELGRGLEGYPFGEMTQVLQVPRRGREQLEAVHRRLHRVLPRTGAAREAGGVGRVAEARRAIGYEALAYEIDGPHGMVSSWGGMSPPKDLTMVKPIERVLHSGLFGPWETPIEIDLPPAVNPARSPAWGIDSFLFFPNFMMLVWEPNWYLTYHYWPTSYNTHIFEGTLYFVPPKNARERLQQELAAVTFKEYSLQDGNTLEATQSMLESRAVHAVPAGRPGDPAAPAAPHRARVRADYQRQQGAPEPVAPGPERGARMATLPAEFADLEPFADWCLEFERERYAKRLASTMAEMQAFYDAAFPRLEAAMEHLDQYQLDALPEDAQAPAVALLLAGERVVPGRGVAPAARARQRRGAAWTSSSNRPSDAPRRWKSRSTCEPRVRCAGRCSATPTSTGSPPMPDPVAAEFQDYLTSMAWGVWTRDGAAHHARSQPAGDGHDRGARPDGGVPRSTRAAPPRTGVTDDEVDELLFQIAAYCGAPAGVVGAAR